MDFRPCSICGRSFSPVAHNGVICSVECRAEAKKRRCNKHRSKKMAKTLCKCGMPSTRGICRACNLVLTRRKLKEFRDQQKATPPVKKKKPIADLPKTWNTCPERSQKTGKCFLHDRPCFEIRTRTQLCRL